MVSARRGIASMGCLLSLLAIVSIAYLSVDVGEAYWRFYEYRDAMRQEARFAANRDDEEIKAHLRLLADSLGLPESAGAVRVKRGRGTVSISAAYSEHVKLPFTTRDFHFAPTVEWTY